MKSYYRETAKMIMDRPRYLAHAISNISIPLSFESKEEGWLDKLFGAIRNLFKKKTEKNFPMPEPESVNMHLNDDMFTKTVTSFSGADVVISINDKLYGEATGVHYHKLFNGQGSLIKNCGKYYDKDLVEDYPVTVVLEYTVFDEMDMLKYIEQANQSGATVNITMTYANEYGQRAVQSIMDCILIEDMSGITIDTIIRDSKMILAAREVTPMEKN